MTPSLPTETKGVDDGAASGPKPRPPADAFVRPSFEVLYGIARSYLPEALRLLKVPPDDVDDLLHDIVLAAHRGLDRYQPRAPYPGEYLDPSRALKTWLSGIAWRQVAKRRGRAYRRFELPYGDIANLPSSPADEAPSSEQIVAEAERREILARVLQQVRPERAEVLVMHAFLGMGVPEIARELGINENTVKSRIGRARADALLAMKRLDRDERNLLEGTPLLLAFMVAEAGHLLAPDPGGESSRAVDSRLRRLQLVAGATLMLVVGVGLGVTVSALHRVPPEERFPIVAAHEAALSSPPTSTSPSAPAPSPVQVESVTVPLVMFGAPTTVSSPLTMENSSETPPRAPSSVVRHAPLMGAADDTTAREWALLRDARGALDVGDYDGALARLSAHERQFPYGALLRDREWLKARALSALAGRPTTAGRLAPASHNHDSARLPQVDWTQTKPHD